MKLKNVGPITRSRSHFQLPDGWAVKKRRRFRLPGSHRPGRADMLLASTSSSSRYRTGETNVAQTSRQLKPGNGKSMQIAQYTFKGQLSFNLPDGWLAVEKPRKNINYVGRIDRFYIEPGTGRQFRSLSAVERYLADGKQYIATPKPTQECGFQKEFSRKKEGRTSNFDFSSVPAKVKWVLNSPGGYPWTPFIDGSLVPKSVVYNWSEAFALAINEEL